VFTSKLQVASSDTKRQPRSGLALTVRNLDKILVKFRLPDTSGGKGRVFAMNIRVGSLAASPSSFDNTAAIGQGALLNYDVSVAEKPQLDSLQVEHSVVSRPALRHTRPHVPWKPDALSPG